MSNLCIFASGSGTNFEAIVKAVEKTAHKTVLLICDKPDALVLKRAEKLSVPYKVISYKNRTKHESEREIREYLDEFDVDVVALAGFMRLLSPSFVDIWENRLLNIHPSLLPKYPGLDAIEKGFEAGETEFGISIHFVDEGMDSGDIILQKSFVKVEGDSLETVEAKVHALEHAEYPKVIIEFLDEYGKDDSLEDDDDDDLDDDDKGDEV